MNSTIEQETDSMTAVETALVIESDGALDDVAEEAVVEAVGSQAETIDARELKAILEAVLFVSPEPVPVDLIPATRRPDVASPRTSEPAVMVLPEFMAVPNTTIAGIRGPGLKSRR